MGNLSLTTYNRGKRIIDGILATGCLVAFSPLLLVCYIAILIEDKGNPIYKQERIGLGGKPFLILKFRSMALNTEQQGPMLTLQENDQRTTRVGGWLRRHHLDELPQLINVLKGDMAFVGPRPERRYFIDKILLHDKRYTLLYQVRPGVTSYATLYNGYTDTLEKMLRRLEMDLHSMELHSWWFDAKILAKTFLHIVSGRVF